MYQEIKKRLVFQCQRSQRKKESNMEMELGNLWVLVLNSQARWHNFVFLMTFWPTKTNSSSVVIALHVQCSCSCVRQHEAVDVFVWFTRHESSTRGSLSAYKWIRQASINEILSILHYSCLDMFPCQTCFSILVQLCTQHLILLFYFHC